MNKQTYYFSHDYNARNDTKISNMINKYGMRGYGIYWVIVEMLREQKDYKLHINDSIAIALQCHEHIRVIKRYIYDCINEYKLFKSDKVMFWSDSLLDRMKRYEDICLKNKDNIDSYWARKRANDIIRSNYECRDIKLNKIKLNENKPIYIEGSIEPVDNFIDDIEMLDSKGVVIKNGHIQLSKGSEKYNYAKGMQLERDWNKIKPKKDLTNNSSCDNIGNIINDMKGIK